jgi:hypothetical protein
MSLHRRLVLVPADLVLVPADLTLKRQALLRRIERVVWAIVLAVQLVMVGGHTVVNVLTQDTAAVLLWRIGASFVPSSIATIAILRFTFRRSVAEARHEATRREFARVR